MRLTTYKPAMRWMGGLGTFVFCAAMLDVSLWAQQPAPPGAANTVVPAAPVASGAILDRVVAVVNDDVILESDVDEEQRFEEIQPYRVTADMSRDRVVQRLIDRTLILQQAELQPETAVTDQEVDEQIATLRKDIPECGQSHCETDAGWQKFLGEHGFTVAEFRGLWLKRMELLRFIEMRFRNGVHISDDEVKEYYEKTMLPEYAKDKMTPPKLDTISQRIEEVLLQQRVSTLLRDWLASLRAQGSVRVIRLNEAGR